MKFLIAFLIALGFAVAGPASASATVTCPNPPSPRPPNSEIHCIYTGADARSDYLHYGNADWALSQHSTVVNGSSFYMGAPPNGWCCWIGHTNPVRHSATRIGPAVMLYDPVRRKFCEWAGIVDGPDTGPFVYGTVFLNKCSTY